MRLPMRLSTSVVLRLAGAVAALARSPLEGFTPSGQRLHVVSRGKRESLLPMCYLTRIWRNRGVVSVLDFIAATRPDGKQRPLVFRRDRRRSARSRDNRVVPVPASAAPRKSQQLQDLRTLRSSRQPSSHHRRRPAIVKISRDEGSDLSSVALHQGDAKKPPVRFRGYVQQTAMPRAELEEQDKPLDPSSIHRNIVRKYCLETGIGASVNSLCVHSMHTTAATNALSHKVRRFARRSVWSPPSDFNPRASAM